MKVSDIFIPYAQPNIDAAVVVELVELMEEADIEATAVVSILKEHEVEFDTEEAK